MPPRQRKIPKTLYHHKNAVFFAGANFSSFSDPQILAAWAWEATMKAPKMIATKLTTTFMNGMHKVKIPTQRTEFCSGSTLPLITDSQAVPLSRSFFDSILR
jgi:hypothetical protein